MGRWLAASLTMSAASASAAVPVGGLVADAAGAPVAGADVTLRPLADPHRLAVRRLEGGADMDAGARTITGAGGRFRLAAPAAGMWRIRVEAAGFVPMEYGLLPLLGERELPDLRLTRVEGVEAKVTDAAGRPLRAHLVAWAGSSSEPFRARIGRERWQPALRSAVTGADGLAVLPRGPGEELTIQVVAPGFAAARRQARSGRAIVLRLSRGAEQRLRFVDRDGRPLSGQVILSGGGPWPLARADNAGRVVLSVPATSRFGFVALGPDGESGSFDPNAPGLAKEERLFELTGPTEVHGTVVDRSDQRPVAGAWVWTTDDPNRHTRTDAGGRYTLRPTPEPEGFLSAAAPDYAQGGARIVTTGPGQARAAIALTPAGSVAGSVVDRSGRPLSEVAVRVAARRDAGLASTDFFTRSSATGQFHLFGLPAGPGYVLHAGKAGFAPGELSVALLEPFEHRSDLKLILGPGALATGRVLTLDETPIPSAEVVLTDAAAEALTYPWTAPGIDHRKSAHTDARGHFEIPDLGPGRFDLRVTARGFAPIRVPGIEIPPEIDEVDIGTVQLAPGAALEGRIVTTSGQPLAGADLYVSEQDPDPLVQQLIFDPTGLPPVTSSDADGRFSLADRRHDEILYLIVSKPGYLIEVVHDVRVAGEEPVVTLERASRLRGRVVDDRGGPVAGARIGFEGTGRAELPNEDPKSDDEGRFVLDVAPGVGTVFVSARGYLPASLTGVEAPAEGELSGLELELQPGAALSGRVFGPNGGPAADARVRVVDTTSADARQHGFRLVDGEGRFFFDALPIGRLSVVAEHPNYSLAVRDVEILPGENTVEIGFGRGLEVSGRVLGLDAVALAGAELRLISPGGLSAPLYALSGADGRFTFHHVPAGTYTAEARLDGYYQAEPATPVVVDGAGAEELELRLSLGITLSGRILGLELEELARVEVDVRDRSGVHRGQVDHTGAYRVRGLTSGEGWVTARLPDSGLHAERRIVIEADAPPVDLELDSAAGHVLTGVVTLDGRPLSGIRVRLSHGEDPFEAESVTDRGGGFRFAALSDGVYRLALSGGVRHREDLEIAGDREVAVELTAARVRGTVRDAVDGRPLADVRVLLRGLGETGPAETVLGGRSDARGRFDFATVTAGAWRLWAKHPGYAPAAVTVETDGIGDSEVLELLLEPAAGLVFNARLDSGRSPPEVLIALLDIDGRRRLGGTWTTAENGRVVMSTVPAGRWQLLLQTEGSAAVLLDVTAPDDLGEVRLPPGGALTVTWADADMAELSLTAEDGTPFLALDERGEPYRRWPLRRGETTLRHLPAGTWTVEVVGRGETWRRTVDILPRHTAALEFPAK